MGLVDEAMKLAGLKQRLLYAAVTGITNCKKRLKVRNVPIKLFTVRVPC